MKINLSLSHILCGIFGFLLGSAGGGAAAYGAKKRKPLSFCLGLFFSLIGAAVVFMSLIDAAVEEEGEEGDEESGEGAAEAAEVVKEAVKEVKEAVADAAEAAEEAVEGAEEESGKPKEEA
ncbi:MAG: hypothetical protein IKN96_08000 [Oscillibacter sp.]|nr:hypothetical protein [Oscillibacter sp.]